MPSPVPWKFEITKPHERAVLSIAVLSMAIPYKRGYFIKADTATIDHLARAGHLRPAVHLDDIDVADMSGNGEKHGFSSMPREEEYDLRRTEQKAMTNALRKSVEVKAVGVPREVIEKAYDALELALWRSNDPEQGYRLHPENASEIRGIIAALKPYVEEKL